MKRVVLIFLLFLLAVIPAQAHFGDEYDYSEHYTPDEIDALLALYLKLTAANDPMQGNLDFNGLSIIALGFLDMQGTIDFGTNTIADGQMAGDWVSLGSVDGGVAPTAVTGISTAGGDLDMYLEFSDSAGVVSLADTSGNGNAVTVTAGSESHCDRGLRVDSVSGEIVASKCFDFNGSTVLDATAGGGYTGPTQNNSTSGDVGITISLWLKTDSATGFICLWGTSGGSGSIGQLRISTGGGGGTAGALQITYGNGNSSSTTVINDGQWHHVVMVWVAGVSGTAHTADIYYVDGVSDFKTANNSNLFLPVASLNFRLGADSSGATPLTGQIDEFAVWDNIALTQTQAQNIFNRQKERYIGGTKAVNLENLDTAIFTSKSIGGGIDNDASSIFRFSTDGINMRWGDGVDEDAINFINVSEDGIQIVQGTTGGSDLDIFSDLSLALGATVSVIIASGGEDTTIGGALILETSDGINYGSGSDVDTDIVTINVTSAPRLWWDESEDEFVFTKPISAPAYRGASDIHMDEDGIFFGLLDEAKIHVGLTADLVDAWILESLDAGHDLLLKTARSLKVEAAEDMEINVETFSVDINTKCHYSIQNGLIEFFGNGPTGEAETLLTMSNDSLGKVFIFDSQKSTIRMGVDPNYIQVDINGIQTLHGTAKRVLTLRPDLDYTTITAQGKPTQITVGAFKGYSMPIYNSDNEELFANQMSPGRWDMSSDPVAHIAVALASGEDVGDYFKLQLSWEKVHESSDILPATTHDIVVEQIILAGRSAQYDIYELLFTLDYDVDTPDNLGAHDLIGFRLRRIDATNPDISGEIIVLEWHVEYQTDKVFAEP